MAALEADGEYAEQLFVHGLGVQTAEGLAEWLHARDPRGPRDRAHAGPALLLGLPGGARPVRALKVEELLDLGQIGMSISDGFAPEPEQSTLAIVAHHPDATYFGMKSGTLPSRRSPARR